MVIDRVKQAARAGGFVGVTATMLPAFLARMKATTDEDRDDVRDRWVKRWARALLALFSVEAVIDGALPPPTRKGSRGRLVIVNHRSAIDIGVVLATFGGTMVSRADLAGWPVIGAAARSVGTIFVNRSNAESGAATIRIVQKALEDGMTINLFPEGTTFDGDVVRPFHGGAFVSAVRAEAEILPVGMAYPQGSGAAFVNETFTAHLARMAKSDATRMVVSVGEPFVVRREDRATDVSKRAHREVSALVARARALCGP
ncbi:MAG: 1-acyl-sn-glycerol-3-phosphate acyltransferase [Deltaproteobacteria bacterium]|nr:1-acyl-sn-glycerol-3-phosphate acyltransferase [Deltaproteobacteria bacterium]